MNPQEAEPMAQLKELIREGIEAADRGELIDGDTVFKELGQRNRQRRGGVEAIASPLAKEV